MPLEHGPDREAVPQIVDGRARSPPAETGGEDQPQKRFVHVVVDEARPDRRYEEARRELARQLAITHAAIAVQRSHRGRVHRDLARLAELGLSYEEHVASPIDVSLVERKRLAD